MPTKRRTVKSCLTDEVWDAVVAAVEAEGLTVSALIEKALARYCVAAGLLDKAPEPGHRGRPRRQIQAPESQKSG